MFETNAAAFRSKEPALEAQACVIEKVVRLSGAGYDGFAANLTKDYDFIKDNHDLMLRGEDGKRHCLLVTGEGRRDGILVDSSGYDYARYTSMLPNAEDFLTVGRYPALAELNRKLAGLVDLIAEHGGDGNPDGRGVFHFQDWEDRFGLDFTTNAALKRTITNMLNDRPEIQDWELDGHDLIVHRAPEPVQAAEDLSDPYVTKADMYAYGYGWDGMIPLSKERALELFDKDHQVYRLYENDAEGAADDREAIETFDGMFGVEDPAWARPEKEPPLEVFILNREKFDKGETSGEWLALPVLPGDLCDVFERIGIDRPSEGAFTISAIRVRDDFVLDSVSKYDSFDELNMLASYMKDNADFNAFKKYQDIIRGGVPEEYRITGMALHALRLNKPERATPDEKPSVMAQIRAAQKRQTHTEPKEKDAQKHKSRDGGPKL